MSSEDQLVSDLVVIGGGPSALMFFLDLVRQGRLLSVLKGKGVTILESGRYFGSGHLEQYLVIGYSMGLDLLRLLLKQPYSANKDAFSSCIFLDQNGQKYIDMALFDAFMSKNILVGFKEIMMTNIYTQLKNYGLTNPPLSAYGFYLRIIGNTLLRLIKSLKGQLIFRPYHEVQNISMQNDGYLNLSIKINDPNGPYEQLYLHTDLQVPSTGNSVKPAVLDYYKTIKCRVLLLSIGSAQMANFTKSRLGYCQDIHKDLRLTSDAFLSDRGFTKALTIMQRVRKQLIMEKKKKTILIIGGSHSAFVCAVLLLKGPKIYGQGESSMLNGKYSSKFNDADVLSPFLQKRNLEGNGACSRCQMLQNRKRASVMVNDSSISIQINSNNSNGSPRNSSNVSQQSLHRRSIDSSSRLSKLTVAAAPSLNGSYLQKRHGLSQIGISVLQQPNIPGNHQRSRFSIGSEEPFQLQSNDANRQSSQFSNINDFTYNSATTQNSSYISNKMNNNSNNYTYNSNNNNNIISNRSSANSTTIPNTIITRQSGIDNRASFSQADVTNSPRSQAAQQTECLCLGSIKPHMYVWKYSDTNLINIAEGEIVILHRSPISLDCTKEELDEDNYVYSALGLKAGAKQLYKDIKHGIEKRVQVYQTTEEEKIKELIQQSYVVIDASGYSSPEIDIRGAKGEKVTLQRDSQNFFKLDSQRRVVSDKGVLRNIFSVGFSSVDTVREERAQLLNDYDTRTAGTGVIEALQDQSQNDRSWRFSEDISLSKSHAFGEEQGQPDYDSANIMDIFNNNRSSMEVKMLPPFGAINQMKSQLDKHKAGLNFNSVQQYQFTKRK